MNYKTNHQKEFNVIKEEENNMGIEEIKELYINNNPEADIRAELWSKNLFGVNVKGGNILEYRNWLY